MFLTKGIDKPAFMSRVKALVGIKRDTPSQSKIFVESRKFTKELENQLLRFDESFKKEKIVEQVYKFINKKRDVFFICLQEYQKTHGWDDTIVLLSTPMVADKSLKEMVEQKDNELKELKTKSILEDHNPTDKEIKKVEQEENSREERDTEDY